ncbi:MAG: hypothetical protein R3C01_01585 [Planctomycetaceae bacterium]
MSDFAQLCGGGNRQFLPEFVGHQRLVFEAVTARRYSMYAFLAVCPLESQETFSMYPESSSNRSNARNPFARNEYESVWQSPTSWMCVLAISGMATMFLVESQKIEGGVEVTKTFLLVQGGIAAAIVAWYVLTDAITDASLFEREAKRGDRQLGLVTRARLDMDENRDAVNQQVATFLNRVHAEMTASRTGESRTSTTTQKSAASTVSAPTSTAPTTTSAATRTDRNEARQTDRTSQRNEADRSREVATDFETSAPPAPSVYEPAPTRSRDIQTPIGTVISMPAQPRLQLVDGFEEELSQEETKTEQDSQSHESQSASRRSPRALRVHRAA